MVENQWQLKHTSNLNQMLRVKEGLTLEQKEGKPNLLIVKHQYHVADDIMFPDPSCLSFFTAFEENHLKNLEDEKKLLLSAVDICEGNIKFYIYCDDVQTSVHNCISFLKSNPLYSVEFEVYNQDNFKTYEKFLLI